MLINLFIKVWWRRKMGSLVDFCIWDIVLFIKICKVLCMLFWEGFVIFVSGLVNFVEIKGNLKKN